MNEYTSKGASISLCGKYRFSLWREWRGVAARANWRWYGDKDGNGAELGDPLSCVFVMLNPSTADADQDDPTIRRCVSFAKALKFDRVEVVNLYAYRATDPKDLFGAGDAMHHHKNQEYVERAARDSGIIICAWGAHGEEFQAETVRGWMHTKKHFALGFTKGGQPRHPLYLPANARPVSMDRSHK